MDARQAAIDDLKALQEDRSDEPAATPAATFDKPVSSEPTKQTPAIASAATSNGKEDGPSRLISREEIMAAQDISWKEVPVDEWKAGSVVWVRSPTSADRDYLEMVILGGDAAPDGEPRRTMGKEEIRAHFIAMCVVKDNGSHERLFDAADIQWLKHKNILPINRIYSAILESAIVTEKDVEDLAKNSGSASGVTS